MKNIDSLWLIEGILLIVAIVIVFALTACEAPTQVTCVYIEDTGAEIQPAADTKECLDRDVSRR